jgi:hypothetical protein
MHAVVMVISKTSVLSTGVCLSLVVYTVPVYLNWVQLLYPFSWVSKIIFPVMCHVTEPVAQFTHFNLQGIGSMFF